jgi:GT2 family glycosyltransferase
MDVAFLRRECSAAMRLVAQEASTAELAAHFASGNRRRLEMTSAETRQPRLGVVVVTYNCAPFVLDTLESLLATGYPNMRIVVVDNASPDASDETVRAWATGEVPWTPCEDWPFAPPAPRDAPIDFAQTPAGVMPERTEAAVTLIRTGANLGFAGGVNAGLRALLGDPETELFWVLNPDALSEPQTPFAFARKAAEMGRFALLGGRILFLERPGTIQIDIGRLHPLAGTAISVNLGAQDVRTPMPSAQDAAFISGASMVASRAFIEKAGLMDESYFLYFEDIDWQLRRGDLPLGVTPDARVLHRAGASIGSAGLSLKPGAFSLYFTSRNLLRFVGRWFPLKTPLAYAMAYVRLLRHSDGTWAQAEAMLRGLHRLAPPAAVRARLPEDVWHRILK